MTVTEVKSKLAELKNSGALKGQTVEFVVDTQKHFVRDLEKNSDGLTFVVTRQNYTPITNDQFVRILEGANDSAKCFIKNADKGGGPVEVGLLHLSSNYLEVSVASE